MSYISTEKDLERALEQTSRFYTDLKHIAPDLGTLTKRYSQSHTSVFRRPINVLDWDWHDCHHLPIIQSPKQIYRKQQYFKTNKMKIHRRTIHTKFNQTEYYESDHDNRSYDYATSPLRRRKLKKIFKDKTKICRNRLYLGHSSVYFDSTDDITE